MAIEKGQRYRYCDGDRTCSVIAVVLDPNTVDHIVRYWYDDAQASGAVWNAYEGWFLANWKLIEVHENKSLTT